LKAQAVVLAGVDHHALLLIAPVGHTVCIVRLSFDVDLRLMGGIRRIRKFKVALVMRRTPMTAPSPRSLSAHRCRSDFDLNRQSAGA
jgi:hypothetical protein